jgi:hypothetical protein
MMSDLRGLGAVEHVAELWSAALALDTLRLDADAQLTPGIRVVASLLNDALDRAAAAVDRALEVNAAGGRMPVAGVPEPGSPRDLDLLGEPQPVWASLRSLIDTCEGFVRTVDMSPLTARDAYSLAPALERVRAALENVDRHHRAADRFLTDGRPFVVITRPDDPEPGPGRPAPPQGGGDATARAAHPSLPSNRVS